MRVFEAYAEKNFARAIQSAKGLARSRQVSIPPPCTAFILFLVSLISRARNDKRLFRPCAFSRHMPRKISRGQYNLPKAWRDRVKSPFRRPARHLFCFLYLLSAGQGMIRDFFAHARFRGICREKFRAGNAICRRLCAIASSLHSAALHGIYFVSCISYRQGKE